jgi:predicted lipoprotein with Yx(FWY)xxD motif
MGRASRRLHRALPLAVAVLAGLVGAASCGSGGGSSSAPSAGHGGPIGSESTTDAVIDSAVLVQVHTRVLVDQHGYALYIYLPDHHRSVTCASTCAVAWPPVFVANRRDVHAGAGVRAGLLGTDPDPVRGTVVTYDHWPLYTYAGDPQPDFAAGQGLDVNGGYWYLLRPDGRPLIPQP